MDNIRQDLYEWIYQQTGAKKYDSLLRQLFNYEFTYKIPIDENRVFDGLSVRVLYAEDVGVTNKLIAAYQLIHPCSVLEMMFGLAYRVETTIMADEDYGDRTAMWFWMMVQSLGLYGLTDDKYDSDVVSDKISKFLNREYEPNGAGGLFTVRGTDRDLRKMQIWDQMNLFFSTLL